MSYREQPPPAGLRPLVGCLWENAPAEDRAQRIVPDGCDDLAWLAERQLVVAGADTGPGVAALAAGRTAPGAAGRSGAGSRRGAGRPGRRRRAGAGGPGSPCGAGGGRARRGRAPAAPADGRRRGLRPEDARPRRATEAGGTILRPIYSFPGGRRFHFADPAGNELAVWSEVTPPG